MPRICCITGKGTVSGNTRSHSMKAGKRTFKPNLLTKKVKADDGKMIRVKISSKVYKKLKGMI